MVDLTAQDKYDLAVGAAMRVMVRGEGWIHLQRILKAQIEERAKDALRAFSLARISDPTMTPEAWMIIQAEQKGALLGIRLALDTPSAIIANADDVLSRMTPGERSDSEQEL